MSAAQPKIVVVDYQMGNLRSVRSALEHLGAAAAVSGDPGVLAAADAVILPGVGAFGDAARELTARGLMQPLREAIAAGKPFLGICLGLQLLFESSEESPGAVGLGVLPGKVVRFPDQPGLKVPHMGWNRTETAHPNALFPAELTDRERTFYFVHSYFVAPADSADVALTCRHGVAFTAAVARAGRSLNAQPGPRAPRSDTPCRLYAVQFHPEKSQTCGLNVLRRFLAAAPTPATASGGQILPA
ncbi:MAG: imidazole glycerol phosphate synthase subunit HisH [Planctomycetota bacterium]